MKIGGVSIRKYISLFLLITCLVCIVGCHKVEEDISDIQKTREKSKITIPVMENTVTSIGKDAYYSDKELSAEDADVISGIIENGNFSDEGTTDCSSDFRINLKGRWLYYHSDCGTFCEYNIADLSYMSSKKAEIKGKSMTVSKGERLKVNAILEKYTSNNFVE